MQCFCLVVGIVVELGEVDPDTAMVVHGDVHPLVDLGPRTCLAS